MKTTTPEEVGKALKDLATRLRKVDEKDEKPFIEQVVEKLVAEGKIISPIDTMISKYNQASNVSSEDFAIRSNSVSEWVKLGYTKKQSKELATQLDENLISSIKEYSSVIEPNHE